MCQHHQRHLQQNQQHAAQQGSHRRAFNLNQLLDNRTRSEPESQLLHDDQQAPVLTIDTRPTKLRTSIAYTKRQPMRDAAINLRALPEQRDLIDHAASLLGKNRSDFMLEAACERARAVVLDQVFFSLDADKFQQFKALLDAPPSPHPGLERLMAVQAPGALASRAALARHEPAARSETGPATERATASGRQPSAGWIHVRRGQPGRLAPAPGAVQPTDRGQPHVRRGRRTRRRLWLLRDGRWCHCAPTGHGQRAAQHAPPHPIPVLVLARLAVDRRAQGMQLGAGLLQDAVHRAVAISQHAGVRALLVHALNEQARQFYAHYGFEESPLHPMTLLLRLNTAKV